MKNFNPKALLTVICNKLKDFLKLTFEFYKYRCRKKSQIKTLLVFRIDLDILYKSCLNQKLNIFQFV